MRGSTASTRPAARAGRSSRLPVGPMRGASSSTWQGSTKRRSPARQLCAVVRIDALFAIEREINGLAPSERVGMRIERSRPLILALETWLGEQRGRVSKNSDTGKAIDY